MNVRLVRLQLLNGAIEDIPYFNAFGPALRDKDVLDVGIEVTQASTLNGGGGSAKYGLLILSTGSMGCCGSR
ncbi:hypothetical protein [Pseudomonas sp. Pseusp16]|uniref:hypothetical protein n=1 Tax=Pseudomonas sp. Pseusp16 TaxID=3243021 RepID=UPI0039B67D88